MSLNNMEEIKKKLQYVLLKKKVQNILNDTKSKKNITSQYHNVLNKKLKDVKDDLNKLIDLDEEIKNNTITEYKKVEKGYQRIQKIVSKDKIKELKNNEHKDILEAKAKLNNFLKDKELVCGLYLTIYLPASEYYKGSSAIYHDGIKWVPTSSKITDISSGYKAQSIDSYYLSYKSPMFDKGAKVQKIYNYLKGVKYEREKVYIDKERSSAIVMKDMDGFQDFNKSFNNIYVSHDKILISFNSCTLTKANDQPLNIIDEKAYDDGNSWHFSCEYIDNKTGQLYKTKYIKEHYKSRSCWLSLICEVYKETFEKIFKKTKITYETVHEIIGDGPLKEKDNGYSIQQVMKFFEKFKIGLYVFDVAFNIVAKYNPPKRNTHISPDCLYVIFHNHHIYHINHNLNRLCHKIERYENKEVVSAPCDRFYTHKFKELENDVKVIYSYEDLKNIISSEAVGDINLVCQSGCLELWMELYKNLKYEAGIGMKNGRINFDGITLKNTNGKNIFISKYSERGVSENKQFPSSETFKNYYTKQRKISCKLLNKIYISNYSTHVASMLKDYYGGPLIGSFETMYDDFDCMEIDYNKYYTSILRDIKKFPVVSKFDNFEDYNDEPIEEYNLYFVEKTNYNLEYPLHKFSLCYGMNIKDIKDNLSIKAVLKPNSLRTNISDTLISEVYNDTTLTETMKKDIFNHIIGMFNKGKNKKTYSTVSSNLPEAFDLN